MICKKIELWEKKEYQYQESYGFIPFLVSYIHEENTEIRPCMIIVPGGGYCMVSPSEAEIVAMKFYEKGWNTFVCTYSTNFLKKTPLKNQPMRDLSRAIRVIRKNAAEFRIRPDQVAVCGFSAGAHLCGSVCVHFDDIADEKEIYQNISNRPDAAVLSYPVITTGEYAHQDSFIALLGADASEAELEYMSLEKQVSSQTPPCFIWQTATDDLVPVQNSFLFAQACKKEGIAFAYHVFSDGKHGLSLANEDRALGRFWKPYTLSQIDAIVSFFEKSNISIPEELEAFLYLTEEKIKRSNSEGVKVRFDNMNPNKEVEVWSDLADTWLKKELKAL